MNTKIRKMLTAAGGNLNLFKRTNKLGETLYIYLENPESEEVILTPIDTSSSDPAKWTYKDENNREYIPREILPTPNKSYEYRTAFRPNLMADLLRELIYKTVTPLSYNIKRAAKEFFSFKSRNISKLRNFENLAWADYLGVNSGLPSSYVETDLRPTQGKTNKKVVRLLDPSLILTPEMIHDLEAKEQAGYKPSTVIKGDEKGLGSYIVSLGKDNNGKPYASYYDDWDLELGVGKSANKLLLAFKSRGNVKHILPGDLGTELTFYDRIPYTPSPIPPQYLQKYASNPGLPSFKFNTPQISWKKKGGSIHIKESLKGSFTKYCNGKVTNECIARGKRSPNPKIRKKATFAANSRKWKHLSGGTIKAGDKAKNNLTKRKNPDWNNIDRAYRYFTLDRGLDHNSAIALLGNIIEESGGSYNAVLKNGGGRGLIQWDNLPVPKGFYPQLKSIVDSVVLPANVYNSKTKEISNYWKSIDGVKGDNIRKNFLDSKVSPTNKATLYAKSYLRPGKPRYKERELSTSQIDSIYNPRIKNIMVKKSGGKAFVEGVNVLDSNPNMYRKKKIRKGEEGTKLQLIEQWISNNKDSISGIISGVSSLVGSGNTYNKKKDALDAQRKAFENSYANLMLDNIDLGLYAALLKQMNPDSNYSSIDMRYLKNLFRQLAVDKAKAYSNLWYLTQLNLLGNEQQQNLYAAAKAISDGVVSMMSNKNKV